MAALTAGRDTKQRLMEVSVRTDFGVAADVHIFQGAQLALNASREVVPADTATDLIPLGRAQFNQDNTGGSAGAFTVQARTGTFKWVNLGGDPLAEADRGNLCYLVDDQTVAKTDGTGTRSPAGHVFDVDPDGVWVTVSYPLAP